MEALKTTIHSTFEAFRLRSNPPKAKGPLNRASEPCSISSQFKDHAHALFPQLRFKLVWKHAEQQLQMPPIHTLKMTKATAKDRWRKRGGGGQLER